MKHGSLLLIMVLLMAAFARAGSVAPQTPASGNSAAPTERQVLEFANRIHQVSTSGDCSELKKLFDFEAMFERSTAGIAFEPLFRKMMIGQIESVCDMLR